MRRIALQFITHETATLDRLSSMRLALEGGCRWVQLRCKGMAETDVLSLAKEARTMCDAYEATLIIDDHVLVAREAKADGVHLGRNDMPVHEARSILGRDFIIGGTANTFDDIQRLSREGADYIGCGPFRFTTTKENLSPTLGLEGYRSLVAQMKQAAITLPLIAIGGITREDIPAIMETGVSGIALSGAIMTAADPAEEVRKLLALL